MLWLSGRRGYVSSPPKAPNFEGADPCAPVNPGGLAGRQQEPVANMTPSSPLPPRVLSAQMLAATAESVQKGITGEGGE